MNAEPLPVINMKCSTVQSKAAIPMRYVGETQYAVGTLTFHPIGILGEGSFGFVILARCSEMQNKLCAVKTILFRDAYGNIDKQMVRSYDDESANLEFLTKSGNPYVQKFILAHKTEDYGYIVTEYYRNGSLATLMSRYEGNCLPSELARFYCAEILAGLGLMHQQGYIHRDVNPTNIFIDQNGHIKIGDFGLSDKCEISTDPSGTVKYMPPERLLYEPYTAASDYWSVAITTYEMNFGCHPTWISSETEDENIKRITEEDILPSYDPDIFGDWDFYGFLTSTLARDPSIRLGGERSSGFEKILDHPYLSGFDRTLLLQGKLPLPERLPFADPRTLITPFDESTSNTPIVLYLDF